MTRDSKTKWCSTWAIAATMCHRCTWKSTESWPLRKPPGLAFVGVCIMATLVAIGCSPPEEGSSVAQSRGDVSKRNSPEMREHDKGHLRVKEYGDVAVLSDGRLKPRHLEVVRDLGYLATLELTCVRADREAWEQLGALDRVRALRIQRSAIPDSTAIAFTDSSSLEELWIFWTALPKGALRHLHRVQTLERLVLEDVDFDLSMSRDIAKCLQLRELWLTNERNLTDQKVEALARLDKLEVLLIGASAVEDSHLKYLSQMKSIKSLNLGQTAVTDKGMAYLAQMESLRKLNLAHTAVTDEGIFVFEQNDKLESIVLIGTNVTEAGLARLQQRLPSVRIVRR